MTGHDASATARQPHGPHVSSILVQRPGARVPKVFIYTIAPSLRYSQITALLVQPGKCCRNDGCPLEVYLSNAASEHPLGIYVYYAAGHAMRRHRFMWSFALLAISSKIAGREARRLMSGRPLTVWWSVQRRESAVKDSRHVLDIIMRCVALASKIYAIAAACIAYMM